MKRLPVILFIFFSLSVTAQDKVSAYFESIRNNEALLTAFFAGMPKGGDLHHHFSGSAWPDYLLEKAIRDKYWVDLSSHTVSREPGNGTSWQRLDKMENQDSIKTAILQHWSVKDYYPGFYPSEKLFFESFGKFDAIMDEQFPAVLLELKRRAKAENLSYLETQLSRPRFSLKLNDRDSLNNVLRDAASRRDTGTIYRLFQQLIARFDKGGARESADSFNMNVVKKLHDELRLDDDSFTIRYQNFVLRFMEPADLFKNLYVNFLSADRSPLIVGVNIVSPEHGTVSMNDYWLHMIMFRYMHRLFPDVKYAMHAGELALGLVAPEELTWHIDAAVRIAGANRIGHGVDIGYEKNSYALLEFMRRHKIPVEINLSSNEFILNIKEDQHPISLYYNAGVPVVISTDDAGILRTSLTRQFVLLAKRYPFISYKAIRQMVYNSIEYSFITDPKLREQLKKDLDIRFAGFEKSFQHLVSKEETPG
jgi:hypothetical protein